MDLLISTSKKENYDYVFLGTNSDNKGDLEARPLIVNSYANIRGFDKLNLVQFNKELKDLREKINVVKPTDEFTTIVSDFNVARKVVDFRFFTDRDGNKDAVYVLDDGSYITHNEFVESELIRHGLLKGETPTKIWQNEGQIKYFKW